MKKIIFIILLCLHLPLFAYETNSYSVVADINSHNKIQFIENIDVNFLTYKHGIYRIIPVSGKMYFKENGKLIKGYKFAKISDVRSNQPFSQEITRQDSGKYEIIKLGSPNKTIIGRQKYTLKYDYTIFKNSYNILYLNLLPIDWRSDIDSFNAKIILPKWIDKTKLNLFYGSYGDTKNIINSATITRLPQDRIEISINLKNLRQGTGLTLFAHIPQGYFTDEATYDNYIYIILGVGVIFLFIAIILWIKYGRDTKIINVVEFYPPNDIDPVYMSYLVNNTIPKKDMTTLLIYMANKKYIKIEATKDIIITKLNEIDKNEPIYIKQYYNALFEEKDTIYYEKLGMEFWEEFDEIYFEALGICRNKTKKFYKDSGKRIKTVIIGLAFMYMLMVIGIILHIGECSLSLLLIDICLFIGYIVAFTNLVDRDKNLKKWKYYGMFILVLALGIFASIVLSYITHTSNMGDYGIVAGILMMMITFFGAYGDAISKNGALLMGKILGFKHYLQVAEISKLKLLVKENPNYFFDIMPYAYIFNLSTVWIDKFKTIDVVSPIWPNMGDVVATAYLYSFLDRANYISQNFDGVNGISSGMPSDFGGGLDRKSVV